MQVAESHGSRTHDPAGGDHVDNTSQQAVEQSRIGQSQMLLSPGTRLGPYEILTPLGGGGMGQVYKATDTRLDRPVAIKVPEDRFSSRFEYEARAIAALSHAHICTLYDVGPDYLVMEFIDGRRLQAKYPPDEAVRLAVQITEALEEAHRKNIIHLDLKPANIMVTASGSVKVLDFGLARLMRPACSEITQTLERVAAGTIGYMSPEQARGEPVDGSSDIFSFGAVLYEMLTGRRPFEGETAPMVLSALLTKPPAQMYTEPALERIVLRCLEKDPALRFSSMREVRLALLGTCDAPLPAFRAEDRPSIAVLAFADMTPARDNEYFSDGLAEEIINTLAHIDGLKVIARTSAFAFKGRNEDVRQIAAVLGVTHVLEGGVRRAGSRIRVTAQLILSRDGSHVWGDRYDREVADVFTVQDEIAGAIAGALKLKLTPATAHHTPSIAAYEAYMLGTYHGVRTTPESMMRAHEMLRKAAELDPAYAPPHSAQGLLHFIAAAWGLRPAGEAMGLVRAAAERALDLDPHLSEAHGLLGVAAGMYDYKWAEARRHFELALASHPVSGFTRAFYSQYHLLPLGRHREAIEQMERVLESDPLHILFLSLLGFSLHAAGETKRCRAELNKALEIEGNHWTIHMISTWNELAEGNLEQARACAEKAWSLAPWASQVVGALAALVSLQREQKRSEELIDQLRALPAHRLPAGMTMYHMIRSDASSAMVWFEKAAEQRDMWAVRFPHIRFSQFLRSHPRWPALMSRMNLPETT